MKTSILNLRNKFLKVTPQRLAIYEYLLETTAHPTAQTIYEDIKVQYPSISFATVYKTLNILRDSNLILEFNVGGDCFRYDANAFSHPHFICKSCEEVMDLDMPKEVTDISELLISNNEGFKVEHTDMYIYGTCRSCNS